MCEYRVPDDNVIIQMNLDIISSNKKFIAKFVQMNFIEAIYQHVDVIDTRGRERMEVRKERGGERKSSNG